MYNSKAYPYPEIVTGESWEVIGTVDNSPAGSTDNLNRQMTVPLDRACDNCGVNHSRMIRRHELGHAKWSPKTMGKLKPGVRAEAVEVLEEIRINELLYKTELPLQHEIMCLDEVDLKANKLMTEGSLASIILMGLAGKWKIKDISEGPSTRFRKHDYNEEHKSLMHVMDNLECDVTVTDLRKSEIIYARRVIQQYYDLIVSTNMGQTISYRKVQKYAEALSKILDMFRDSPKKEDVFKPKPKNTAPGMDEGKAEESNESGGGSLEQRTRTDLTDMLYRSSQGEGTWGKMQTHTPPLTVNLQGRLKGGRNYRPADFGYNPKYINRYCIDKKIFKQKQTQLGGTILIDASGSMSFYGEDILEIMNILPAVTIAMYNGRSATGDLRIIARNGKRVSETYLERHSGYGNVVDGPALEWLGTQPARRIWVSDMHVFGAHGASNGFNLLKDVYNMVAKYNIVNLKNIEEVKEHALKLNM